MSISCLRPFWLWRWLHEARERWIRCASLTPAVAAAPWQRPSAGPTAGHPPNPSRLALCWWWGGWRRTRWPPCPAGRGRCPPACTPGTSPPGSPSATSSTSSTTSWRARVTRRRTPSWCGAGGPAPQQPFNVFEGPHRPLLLKWGGGATYDVWTHLGPKELGTGMPLLSGFVGPAFSVHSWGGVSVRHKFTAVQPHSHWETRCRHSSRVGPGASCRGPTVARGRARSSGPSSSSAR